MISKIRKRFRSSMAVLLVVAFGTLGFVACGDLEVADYDSEFRLAPTVERAPTVQAAPTVAVAPTVAQFEGFKEAPTATKFEGFEQAPTVTQADGFKQAPTVTQFEGFNDDDDPCTIYLDKPSPENAKRAVEWAMGYLDGAGGDIDPNDGLRVAAACEAVLGNAP